MWITNLGCYLLFLSVAAARKKKSDPCEILIEPGRCLWTVVYDTPSFVEEVTAGKAAAVSAEKNSVLGQIPDSDVYEKIVKNIRSKNPLGRRTVFIRTGIEVKDGEVSSSERGAFLKWDPLWIDVTNGYGRLSDVVIMVHRNASEQKQGMGFIPKETYADGVLCESSNSFPFLKKRRPVCKCEVVVGDGSCLCVEWGFDWRVNYDIAAQICAEKNASLAQIANKRVYNKLRKRLRKEMGPQIDFASLWFGLVINPLTGEVVHPKGAFLKWKKPQKGNIGENFSDWKHMAIEVNNPNSQLDGMENPSLAFEIYGALCQRPIK